MKVLRNVGSIIELRIIYSTKDIYIRISIGEYAYSLFHVEGSCPKSNRTYLRQLDVPENLGQSNFRYVVLTPRLCNISEHAPPIYVYLYMYFLHKCELNCCVHCKTHTKIDMFKGWAKINVHRSSNIHFSHPILHLLLTTMTNNKIYKSFTRRLEKWQKERWSSWKTWDWGVTRQWVAWVFFWTFIL